VSDKNSAKDILKLQTPKDATPDLQGFFENQAVPLNMVVMADQERDFESGRVCTNFF
jgi:hypothetical protein